MCEYIVLRDIIGPNVSSLLYSFDRFNLECNLKKVKIKYRGRSCFVATEDDLNYLYNLLMECRTMKMSKKRHNSVIWLDQIKRFLDKDSYFDFVLRYTDKDFINVY